MWPPPSAMETTERPASKVTLMGVLLSEVDPVPSSPFLPKPQHLSEASSRTAQVCVLPAASASAVRPVPRSTLAGVLLSVVLPRPSCP